MLGLKIDHYNVNQENLNFLIYLDMKTIFSTITHSFRIPIVKTFLAFLTRLDFTSWLNYCNNSINDQGQI